MPTSRKAKPSAPRLPRFSPTRLSKYLTCPRIYHFYYDRGLRWGGVNAGQSFGGSMHRALQSFHGSGGAGAMSLEALQEKLESRWSDAGYASPEEAASFREAALRLLEAHHQASDAQSSVEPGRVTVAVEKTLERRYEDFVLFGKIDRIDRRPDGSLEVLDYKSVRRAVREEDVRRSLAMTVYQLLVARAHPGVTVHAGILSLQTGASAFVTRSAEELDEAEAEISALVRKILADFEKPPIPGEPCRSCSYPRLCPPGQAWLLEHG